jgi:hypothetical protein
MKRTMTFLLGANILVLLSLFLVAYTQANAGRTEEYCKVYVSHRLMNKRVIAAIDYGEETGIPAEKLETRIVKGVSYPFYSEVDLLHYLNEQGWELVAGWDDGWENQSHHLIMKRRL